MYFVQIPFWWDHQEEELIGRIRKVIPHFLSNISKFKSVEAAEFGIKPFLLGAEKRAKHESHEGVEYDQSNHYINGW